MYLSQERLDFVAKKAILRLIGQAVVTTFEYQVSRMRRCFKHARKVVRRNNAVAIMFDQQDRNGCPFTQRAYGVEGVAQEKRRRSIAPCHCRHA